MIYIMDISTSYSPMVSPTDLTATHNPLSFRYTIPENGNPRDLYIYWDKVIKQYLGHCNVKVIKQSAGYHDDSSRPHIHLHYILSQKLLHGNKSSYDVFRDWCKNASRRSFYDKLTLVKRGASFISNPSHSDSSGNKVPFKPSSFSRFLGYPFKCNHFYDYVEDNIHYIESDPKVQKLIVFSRAEHEATLQFQKKKLETQRKKQYKKSKLEQYVLENNPETLTDCYYHTLQFYKIQVEETGEALPNFSTMIHSGEAIAFQHNFISFDDVIRLIRPQHKDIKAQALNIINENNLNK